MSSTTSCPLSGADVIALQTCSGRRLRMPRQRTDGSDSRHYCCRFVGCQCSARLLLQRSKVVGWLITPESKVMGSRAMGGVTHYLAKTCLLSGLLNLGPQNQRFIARMSIGNVPISAPAVWPPGPQMGLRLLSIRVRWLNREATHVGNSLLSNRPQRIAYGATKEYRAREGNCRSEQQRQYSHLRRYGQIADDRTGRDADICHYIVAIKWSREKWSVFSILHSRVLPAARQIRTYQDPLNARAGCGDL